MKDKIQITEEQARDMTRECKTSYVGQMDDMIRLWKKEGYIKKSKLEEAREYYSDFKNRNQYDHVRLDVIKWVVELYEQAIEEIKKEDATVKQGSNSE